MKKFIKVVLKGYWWLMVAAWCLVMCGEAAFYSLTYPDDSIHEISCKIVKSAIQKIKTFFRD